MNGVFYLLFPVEVTFFVITQGFDCRSIRYGHGRADHVADSHDFRARFISEHTVYGRGVTDGPAGRVVVRVI